MEKKIMSFMIRIYLNMFILLHSCTNAENISRGKPVRQLGTFEQYGADRAVDGNTNQNLEAGSCAYPNSFDPSLNISLQGTPTWWSVDLADGDSSKRFVIKSATIYFHNAYLERHKDSHILVGNSSDVETQTECAVITEGTPTQNINCRPDTPVRYFTIRHKFIPYLTICEVIVEGYEYLKCPQGWMGEGCKTPCHCPYTCNDITGDCHGNSMLTHFPTTDTTATPTVVDTVMLESSKSDIAPAIIVPIITVFIIAVISFVLIRRFQNGKPNTCKCCMDTKSPEEGQMENKSKQDDGTAYEAIDEMKPTTENQGTIAADIYDEIDETKMATEHKAFYSSHAYGYDAIDEAIVIIERQGASTDSSDGESNVVIEEAKLKKQSVPRANNTEGGPYEDFIPTSKGPMHDIKVDHLATYIRMKKSKKDSFDEEFKKLPIGPVAKCNVGNAPGNKKKNRFLNIKAYDHSRVILGASNSDYLIVSPTSGSTQSDYINANFLSGYGGKEVYIATQAPQKATIKDMWQMVWETNSNRIIALADTVEGGKTKYDEYWPAMGTRVYGRFKVTLVDTDSYAAYVIRTFNIEFKGKSRAVHQFHFMSWPDHGVPRVATDLLEFRKRVNTLEEEASGPLIIHCSAGTGRTGVYIAIDRCLEQARKEKVVNVWEVTCQMRTERMNMINDLDQYIFVFDALLEAVLSGETRIYHKDRSTRKEFEKLCERDPESNKSFLTTQFETLETLKTPTQDGKPLSALESVNIEKNRSKMVVPSNHCRPVLSTVVEGTTDYINAVNVDGFRSKKAYIVTQMPLPYTVVDFWRLIHDHKSFTIVMLNQLERNDKGAGIYWPEEKNQTLMFGPLMVMMTAVDTSHPHITTRDFAIINTESKQAQVTRQFQLQCWAEKDRYPDTQGALPALIDIVDKWQKQTDKGPITIHCNDGVTQSGMFVAGLYALEQLKADQEVDVFTAIKQVRKSRPEFIQDIDKYRFTYEMVLDYMDYMD